MGILEVLTLIFIVLKAVGVISWSWWLVLSPILLPFAIGLLLLAIGGLIVLHNRFVNNGGQ